MIYLNIRYFYLTNVFNIISQNYLRITKQVNWVSAFLRTVKTPKEKKLGWEKQ